MSDPSSQALALEVVVLKRQGMSNRAIARALKLSRKKVAKIVAEHERARSEPHLAIGKPPARAPRPSKLDPYRARVEELLEHFPAITAQRVFEELLSAGFDGGYTVVKELVRKTRPKLKPKPSMPTEPYEPGKLAECDWSSYTQAQAHPAGAVCRRASAASSPADSSL